MGEHQQYTRPPIAEALIALRTDTTAQPLEQDRFNPLPQELRPAGDLRVTGVQFEHRPDQTTASSTDAHVGFNYRSADGRWVTQVVRDGVIVSWVNASGDFDWPGWNALSDLTRRVWGSYLAAAEPSSLNALVVRYVNELNLSVSPSGASLDEYLRTLPDLSRDLPNQLIAAYQLQLKLPQPDREGVTAYLNQAMLPSDRAGQLRIGLDIEVVQTLNLPSPEDVEEIWSKINWLHDRENAIFEASVTDRTRKFFEHAVTGAPT